MLQIGIKAIDCHLTDIEIQPVDHRDNFQAALWITPSMKKVDILRGLSNVQMPQLPYSIVNAVNHNREQSLLLTMFADPRTKESLCGFLLNDAGVIIERVYYNHKSIYKSAFEKIEHQLVRVTQIHSKQIALQLH